jgi:hypothetical protein
VGAGEAGGLRAGVKPGRQIDPQGDGERGEAEEDHATGQPPPARLQRRQREDRGEQGDQDLQVGVCLHGATRGDGRGRGETRQTGIGGLADLDRAINDELGGNKAGSRGEDGGADRPPWRDHCAGAGRRAGASAAGPPQSALSARQAREEQSRRWPQQAPESLRRAGGDRPQPLRCARQRRLAQLEQAIGLPVGPPRKGRGSRQRHQDATPHRCYHRASLRQLFRRWFGRARKGLFHAPIPALAGRLTFHPSPLLHDHPLP